MSDVGDIWAEKNPEVAIIAHRYERAELHVWNNSRVAALATALKKTVWVLCAEAGAFTTEYHDRHEVYRLKLDKAMIVRCWKLNRWPIFLTLHFERLESCLKPRQNSPNRSPRFLGVSDVISAKLLAGTL